MEVRVCVLPQHGNLVAADCFGLGVQRLSDIADEVDEEFERLLSVCGVVSSVIDALGLHGAIQSSAIRLPLRCADSDGHT